MRRLTALLLPLLLLLAAGPAAAASYPVTADDVSVSSSPTPGEDVTFTVSGLAPNTDVTSVLSFGASSGDCDAAAQSATSTSDGDGTASFTFAVPASADGCDTATLAVDGAEVLTVQLAAADAGDSDDADADGGAGGDVTVVVGDDTSAGQGGLAATGTDALTLALTGGGLLLAGLVLLSVRRARRYEQSVA